MNLIGSIIRVQYTADCLSTLLAENCIHIVPCVERLLIKQQNMNAKPTQHKRPSTIRKKIFNILQISESQNEHIQW
jgi:hypothetical protein